MILNKRISKFRIAPTQTPQEGTKNMKPPRAPRNSRCRFIQIPQNAKFVSPDPLYPLIGDLPLRNVENGLSIDISVYNHFKVFRNIEVTNFFGEKVIKVKPTSKNLKILETQDEVVEQLHEMKSFDNEDWTKIITTFYQKYSKVMTRQTHKTTKCDVRKKFFAKTTAKTVEKKRELYEKYPCAEFQFRLRNHHSHLIEIILNDKYIKDLGYSEETFISTVMKEGFPRISLPNASYSSEIKMALDNYFQIDNDGFATPIKQTTVILKNGFVRDVQYQPHILMNYETNAFGMDVIVALVSKGEPYLPKQPIPEEKVNEEFVKEMATRESEMEYLLSTFYNESRPKIYTDGDMTCRVKEIAPQD